MSRRISHLCLIALLLLVACQIGCADGCSESDSKRQKETAQVKAAPQTRKLQAAPNGKKKQLKGTMPKMVAPNKPLSLNSPNVKLRQKKMNVTPLTKPLVASFLPKPSTNWTPSPFEGYESTGLDDPKRTVVSQTFTNGKAQLGITLSDTRLEVPFLIGTRKKLAKLKRTEGIVYNEFKIGKNTVHEFYNPTTRESHTLFWVRSRLLIEVEGKNVADAAKARKLIESMKLKDINRVLNDRNSKKGGK